MQNQCNSPDEMGVDVLRPGVSDGSTWALVQGLGRLVRQNCGRCPLALVHADRFFTPDRRHEIDTAEIREFFAPEASDILENKDGFIFAPIPARKGGPLLCYEYLRRKGFSVIWIIRDGDGKSTAETGPS